MFAKLNSKSFQFCWKSFIFIVIFNSIPCFGQNTGPVSTEFNITVTSRSGKNVMFTAPKLLGIFADGVNDNTNILNNSKFNVDIDINNQAQNESKPMYGNRIPMNKNRYAVPQNESNSTLPSIQNTGHSLESAVEPTEPSDGLRLNPCKRITFQTTNEESMNESQASAHCVLGSAPDVSSDQQLPYSDTAYMAAGLVNDIDFYYYNIPEEDMETIDTKSYIAIMVNVCSEPKGQVLIIDEMSNEQLFSFNNLGTTRICNNWDMDYESFVSDSNKVRIELAVPRDNANFLHKEFHFLSDKEGSRHIWNDNFNMTVVYFEIVFRNNTSVELTPDDSYREAIYQPNSVFTYKLMPPPYYGAKRVTKIGLQIYLDYLNIDVDAGDFVLIGAGSEPSNRELSSAQIIAKMITKEDEKKKIWVNADSAYIRLVTHNSFKNTGTALRFSWESPNDTLVEPDEEKVSDRIKNSAIQICIIGSMCQQFQNALEDRFKGEITHITNDFLFNKERDNKEQEDETKKLVSKKSVLLFGKEDGIYGQQDEKNRIYCQMNLAITSAFNEQWPLVSHNTLHYIFFGNGAQKLMHSFGEIKVTDCSNESISLLKMILPIIVILIVSIALLSIAWRYQYRNWTHLQRTENAKYRKPLGDPNEDEPYAKDNPIFVDDETNSHTRRDRTTSQTNRIDSVDGRPTTEHKPLCQQLSLCSSSTSSRMLPSVQESPEFVKNLWLSPGTSRQQNEYVLDDFGQSANNKSEVKNSPNHRTKDKANTYSRSSGDTLTAQLPITGLNGTQHESLRSYPRSALRRPTIVSENEVPVTIDGHPVRRSSKVQFELPFKLKKIATNDSVEETD